MLSEVLSRGAVLVSQVPPDSIEFKPDRPDHLGSRLGLGANEGGEFLR